MAAGEQTLVRRLTGENGVVLLITSMALLVLMGLMALAIDMSLAMTDRRTAQNAADHAALSAAYTKCTSGNPTAAANAAVIRNGYTVSDLTLSHLGGNSYEAVIDSENPTFFGRVLGFSALDVSTRAVGDCSAGGGGGNAIFAMGDTCESFGKEQLDISGSSQTVYGGVHSNDNADISGSNNDFGDTNPPLDPFTYVSSITQGGSNNDYDAGYPAQIGILPPPVTFNLGDYQPGGSSAIAAGSNYFYVNGDIDGSFIESNGNGLYYATGKIDMDKTVNLDVTLVAEDELKISGSSMTLDPYLDGLLAYGANVYSGIDQCDKFVVSMGGSNQNWTGIIYGPHGLVEMNGSSNTALTGSLVGYSVRLNGSNLTIIADPSLFPGDPFVALVE